MFSVKTYKYVRKPHGFSLIPCFLYKQPQQVLVRCLGPGTAVSCIRDSSLPGVGRQQMQDLFCGPESAQGRWVSAECQEAAVNCRQGGPCHWGSRTNPLAVGVRVRPVVLPAMGQGGRAAVRSHPPVPRSPRPAGHRPGLLPLMPAEENTPL